MNDNKRNCNLPFSSDERGAGLIEYALILILVGVIVFVLLTLLGPAISKFISDMIATV